MKDIGSIDADLRIDTKLDQPDIRFYSVKEEPFRIYGLLPAKKGECFTRLPHDVAQNTNEGVAWLYTNTAGGRVRFATDSPYVAISVRYPDNGRLQDLSHMPRTGTSGFDLYELEDGSFRYVKSFIPPHRALTPDGYESIHRFGERKMRDLTVNFPYYNGVQELYIGLADGCTLTAAKPYRAIMPIVYYGSSITQCGCASRPGTGYQSIITRALDCDHINLGFSGSARGEQVMADYIATLEMSCFVYAYDHNAPSVEHLQATHKPMFDTVRAAQPDLPIIILTSVCRSGASEEHVAQRSAVIKDTYDRAVAAGDRNVWFIDGDRMFSTLAGELGTVDGSHPNDFGFKVIADHLLPLLKQILKL